MSYLISGYGSSYWANSTIIPLKMESLIHYLNDDICNTLTLLYSSVPTQNLILFYLISEEKQENIFLILEQKEESINNN